MIRCNLNDQKEILFGKIAEMSKLVALKMLNALMNIVK